jgi:hypothetical protein
MQFLYNPVLITEEPSSRGTLCFEVLLLKFELHKPRIYKTHGLRRFKVFVDKFKCHYGSTTFTNWRTNRLKTSNLGGEQDSQFTYNVTLRRVRITTVTVEKQ